MQKKYAVKIYAEICSLYARYAQVNILHILHLYALPTLLMQVWQSLNFEMEFTFVPLNDPSLSSVRVIGTDNASQLPTPGREVNGHSHKMFCSVHPAAVYIYGSNHEQK